MEEITLSRSHDAQGWIIEGREGEVYDTPNQALQKLEDEAPDDDEADEFAVQEAPQQPYSLFRAPSEQAHIFPSRWDARTANRLIKYYYPKQFTEIEKRGPRAWAIQLTPILPATELSTVKCLSTADLEELQRRHQADSAAQSTGRVREPQRLYGGQAPCLTLTLTNEITGDVWTHPIGRQATSALSEWWTDLSDCQRRELPYEVEEIVSRIVAAYAEAEHEDDPRPLRPATADEIRAYLMAQSGTVAVDIDENDRRVHCQHFSEEGRCLEWWVHSHADEWTVTAEGGHTWLRGPNGLGWISTNEATITEEERRMS